jgi:hypothetical protein
LVDPPDGFEQRVLDAERLAHGEVTFGQRVGRAISILAGYSMRPQLAMAALLLLMIGSSLLFLRARPGQRGRVHVTERGVPEARDDNAELPSVGEGEPPEPLAAAPEEVENDEPSSGPGSNGEDAMDRRGIASARRSADREESSSKALPSDELAEELALDKKEKTKGSSDDAAAALQQAREVLQASGCTAAASEFDHVALQFPGSAVGHEALWRAAECRRRLGDHAKARLNYETLLGVPAYKERAAQALSEIEEVAKSRPTAAAKPVPAAAPKAASKKSAADPELPALK